MRIGRTHQWQEPSSALSRHYDRRVIIERIAVLGLGKVGHLVAELLAEAGLVVTGIDTRATHLAGVRVVVLDVGDEAALEAELAAHDAVISCLPYHFNRRVADVAHRNGLHYFDLTEDVPTTRHIRELAESSDAVMAPQCGLAPGLVGIVAAHLESQMTSCRSLRLRVGALPQHPRGLLGYAFNWSPEGVVNEYLNDCEVIEDGERKMVSAMEWHETLYVSGTKLEAFTTSGGLGTMCETYLGRVDDLDYKTLRYPGHVDQMNFFFHELRMREDRELAGRILTNAKPPVNDDVVHIHVAAEGMQHGRLHRNEFVRSYYPRLLCGAERTAISWTTAASAAAVVELVGRGLLEARGFIRQEQISFDALTSTPTGALFLDT